MDHQIEAYLLQSERVSKIFNTHDVDESGALSYDELIPALRAELAEAGVTARLTAGDVLYIIAECDKDGDQCLSHDEMLPAMGLWVELVKLLPPLAEGWGPACCCGVDGQLFQHRSRGGSAGSGSACREAAVAPAAPAAAKINVQIMLCIVAPIVIATVRRLCPHPSPTHCAVRVVVVAAAAAAATAHFLDATNRSP